MTYLVVAALESEELAWGAARLFRDAGRSRGDLTLLSQGAVGARLAGLVRHLQVDRLMERDSGGMRRALIGAAIGSGAIEAPVLAWLFLGVDQATAAGLGMDLLALRAFIAGAAWKFGAVLGGYIGLFLGPNEGLDPELLRGYEEHLIQGHLVLAARVARERVPEAHGIFIESAAFAIGDFAGSIPALTREKQPHPAR